MTIRRMVGLELFLYQNNISSPGEWNITSIEVERRVLTYNCCVETFPTLFFRFNLRRKTIYYGYNVIAPCVMLSFLTVTLFYLPCDSNEKITLGLTVLLAYTVFMLMIRDRMPETSDSLPLLGQFELAPARKVKSETSAIFLHSHNHPNRRLHNVVHGDIICFCFSWCRRIELSLPRRRH